MKNSHDQIGLNGLIAVALLIIGAAIGLGWDHLLDLKDMPAWVEALLKTMIGIVLGLVSLLAWYVGIIPKTSGMQNAIAAFLGGYIVISVISSSYLNLI